MFRIPKLYIPAFHVQGLYVQGFYVQRRGFRASNEHILPINEIDSTTITHDTDEAFRELPPIVAQHLYFPDELLRLKTTRQCRCASTRWHPSNRCRCHDTIKLFN